MGFAVMTNFVFVNHFIFCGTIRNWNKVMKILTCIVAGVYPVSIIVAQL